MKFRDVLVCLIVAYAAVAQSGETHPDRRTGIETDWPQWRGPRRDGTWHGPAVRNEWPQTGLKTVWKSNIGGGFSGIVVARGRMLTMDREVLREPPSKGESDQEPKPGRIIKESERILCLDAASGREVWKYSYPVTYGMLDYGNGPRAAPTIIEDRVLTLGALGKLCCLSLSDGRLLWSHDLVADFKGRIPTWGYSASPLVYTDSVIVFAGGTSGHCVVALNLATGDLKWNSLDDEAGYSWPVIAKRNGHDQLVCWTPSHVRGIDAATGQPYWSIPYEVTYGVSIATPIVHDNIALVCGYWHGSKAILLGDQPTDARLLWEENRFLRGLMSQPLYRDGYVYLLDKQYGLTCFELKTGQKVWDDKNTLTPRGRNPQASLVWLGRGDQILALNSNGELVLARINPAGYSEQARADIIGDTWAHPALAGRFVYARNDSEFVCVELPIAPATDSVPRLLRDKSRSAPVPPLGPPHSSAK